MRKMLHLQNQKISIILFKTIILVKIKQKISNSSETSKWHELKYQMLLKLKERFIAPKNKTDLIIKEEDEGCCGIFLKKNITTNTYMTQNFIKKSIESMLAMYWKKNCISKTMQVAFNKVKTTSLIEWKSIFLTKRSFFQDT